MRTTVRPYDFSPLYRSFVGLDRMASLIDAASAQTHSQTGYPPYNVARLDEDSYRIELAVAGFDESELDIRTDQNLLTITGRRAQAEGEIDEDQPHYLHRGIAERGFERRFQLADHVVVDSAELRNGLLTLSLRRELPEALKPRTIAIGSANTNSVEADSIVTEPKSGGEVKAA